MKKFINALVVVASVAFASMANAGIIFDTDSSILEANVSGGQVVTQTFDNADYINYTFKDNFVLLDIMVSNFNYLFYDFSVTSSDGSNTDSLVNAYLPAGLNYYEFDAEYSFIEIEFDNDQESGTQVGFEIEDEFEFSNVLLNTHFNDDYAVFDNISYSNEFETIMGNFEISAMGTSALSGTTSVPEPSTWMLFGTVLMGLGVSKRLKIKKNLLK